MAKKVDVKEYQCELIKVLDGDTIDCFIDLGFNLKTKKRIRYMGIDTWESRTKDLEEKKKGLAAKARNKELLEGGVFKLKSFGTGKFGRVLGEIWINCTEDGHDFNGWTNVNKWLCENGYAVGYTGQNKDDVKDEHWKNRVLLAEQGVHDLLPWDED